MPHTHQSEASTPVFVLEPFRSLSPFGVPSVRARSQTKPNQTKRTQHPRVRFVRCFHHHRKEAKHGTKPLVSRLRGKKTTPEMEGAVL
mmetsp:Transcript_20111/g.41330  ORF Transcript_20111/g.41330 Transcript_20111/m.41330 type:complete len:88 (+) Transcript_20111:418-681(+)